MALDGQAIESDDPHFWDTSPRIERDLHVAIVVLGRIGDCDHQEDVGGRRMGDTVAPTADERQIWLRLGARPEMDRILHINPHVFADEDSKSFPQGHNGIGM